MIERTWRLEFSDSPGDVVQSSSKRSARLVNAEVGRFRPSERIGVMEGNELDLPTVFVGSSEDECRRVVLSASGDDSKTGLDQEVVDLLHEPLLKPSLVLGG